MMTTFPPRSRRRVAALVVIAVVTAAACSSSTKSTSSPTTAGGSSSPGSTVPGSSKIPAPPQLPIPSSPVKAGGGSGNLSGPGVTPTTITIGQVATSSGPVPGLFQTAFDGLTAYVNYVNSQGGLFGRKLVVKQMDDQLSCNIYTQDMQKLSTQVFAIVGNMSVFDSCGDSVLNANPQLPAIQASVLQPQVYSIPNAFTGAPNPPGYYTGGFQYIKSKFPNDITKSATLYSTAAAPESKEQILTAQSLGYNFIYSRGIGITETNFTSDILRMKNDGVKIVSLGAVENTDIADFQKQAAQQGFHPDAVISSPAYDPTIPTLLGGAPSTNLYAPLVYSLYLGEDAKTVPEVGVLNQWLAKINVKPTLYAVNAWAAGMLFTQALKSAGSAPTQAGVLAELSKIHQFNAGGLTSTTDVGRKQGPACVIMAQYKGPDWNRINPKSGFDCSGYYYSLPVSALS